MNILYTCDDKFLWLMCISMISLFEANKNVKDIHIYLIGEDISKENKKRLKHIVDDYKRNCTIIDMPNIEMPTNFYNRRWPKVAYTRLFCGEILPKSVKKIIYLDCDTVVKQNLGEIYSNKNVWKNTINGVKDCVSEQYKRNIGLDKNDNYINTGVLFINVDMLRDFNIRKEINKFINKYEKIINYPDQDTINNVFKKTLGSLDAKYNVMTLNFAYPYADILKLRKPSNYYSEKEINNAIKRPYIIHYTTNMTVIRPWFSNSNHPRKRDFMDIYLSQEYFQHKLEKFSTNSMKYKFFNFMLHLPKRISYPCLGIIHSKIVPLIKKIKATYKRN